MLTGLGIQAVLGWGPRARGTKPAAATGGKTLRIDDLDKSIIVALEVDGGRASYHAGRDGQFRYCANPVSPAPGGSGGVSTS